MQDDLRAVGFGHEIGGTMSQRRDLVLLTVALGGHDDRDKRQLGIIPDLIQEGVAVHHRHHHIQENQGDTVLMLPQDFQSFLPVFRLQNLIAVGQYLVQNRTVQFVILNNENLLPHSNTLFSLYSQWRMTSGAFRESTFSGFWQAYSNPTALQCVHSCLPSSPRKHPRQRHLLSWQRWASQ